VAGGEVLVFQTMFVRLARCAAVQGLGFAWPVLVQVAAEAV
jgi:hypothetical protein